jgi:hypothetical protein
MVMNQAPTHKLIGMWQAKLQHSDQKPTLLMKRSYTDEPRVPKVPIFGHRRIPCSVKRTDKVGIRKSDDAKRVPGFMLMPCAVEVSWKKEREALRTMEREVKQEDTEEGVLVYRRANRSLTVQRPQKTTGHWATLRHMEQQMHQETERGIAMPYRRANGTMSVKYLTEYP